jgi:hypothetical protein
MTRQQLFFSNTPVSLCKAEGEALFIDKEKSIGEHYSATRSSEETSKVEKRNGSLWRNIDDLGPEYRSLAVDAVPRIDANFIPICPRELNAAEENRHPSTNDYDEIIESNSALITPLIKCKRDGLAPIDSTSSRHCAYASGIRSALLNDLSKGEWYRLKGCGMPEGGFTVVDALDDNNKPILYVSNRENAYGEEGEEIVVKKIRGAAYPHTANTELVMTEVISRLLAPSGIVCANQSIGRWDYMISPLNNTFPLMTRSCVLFKTLGDKRSL